MKEELYKDIKIPDGLELRRNFEKMMSVAIEFYNTHGRFPNYKELSTKLDLDFNELKTLFSELVRLNCDE